ncbi:MAG: hypothetical protein WDM78_07620 [Puia sp.]
MELVPGIKLAVQSVLTEKYNYRVDIDDILVNETKPEFTGDYTVVLFSFSKILKTSPDNLGLELGEALLAAKSNGIVSYNVIKGFLNLILADNILTDFLNSQYNQPSPGKQPSNGKTGHG